MKTPFELVCKDIDGAERTFKVYRSMQGENEILFAVITPDSKLENGFFEMLCVDRGDSFKIETMIHHKIEEYSKKSIPEYLIMKVSEKYKTDIFSSSKHTPKYKPDSLNESAITYWDRLKDLRPERVDYDEKTGRYSFRYIGSSIISNDQND